MEWSKISLNIRKNRLLGNMSKEKKELFETDEYAILSLTYQKIAKDIANIILNLNGITAASIITDATSSVGGNTLEFAKVFNIVKSIEINPIRYNMLVNNLKLFDIKNVLVFNTDYIKIFNILIQDVIFIDPPWGSNYKKMQISNLNLGTKNLAEICNNVGICTKYIILKVPLTFQPDAFLNKLIKKWNIYQINRYEKPYSMMLIILRNLKS